MYRKIFQLTLSGPERRAIDAVYGKYCTGDIYHLIIHGADSIDDHADINWFDDGLIIFEISHWAAFSIIGLCKLEDYLYPLWSKELAQKFNDFAKLVTGIDKP